MKVQVVIIICLKYLMELEKTPGVKWFKSKKGEYL